MACQEMSRFGVLPIYPYPLGEEGESLRVGRREVVVGGLSGVCMGFNNLCLQAGRQVNPDCYCL